MRPAEYQPQDLTNSTAENIELTGELLADCSSATSNHTEMDLHPDDQPGGPFIELTRAQWADIPSNFDISLDQETLEKLRSVEDPTSLADVREVYLPLTRLINLYRKHTGQLYQASNRFLGLSESQTPFVIAITGSVAVGKSTVARLLQRLLSSLDENLKVDLVTTDGFLMSNAELAQRGLSARKGFPESYHRRDLLKFIVDVKSGMKTVKCPVYSHVIYDVVPGEYVEVTSPDILIIEGLNVLQPGRRHTDGSTALSPSDFVDFSVYVDANVTDIRRWFLERILRLRQSAFTDPNSYFKQWVNLSDEELLQIAGEIWDSCNGVNLMYNVRPTRSRATVILQKGHDHNIETVRIRKI